MNRKKYTLEQIRQAWGAGKAMQNKNGENINKEDHFLKNKWFHSFDDKGDMVWQGQILAVDEIHNRALCQFYSWWDGCPTNQKFTQLIEMNNWLFYDSDLDMRWAYYKKYPREIDWEWRKRTNTW